MTNPRDKKIFRTFKNLLLFIKHHIVAIIISICMLNDFVTYPLFNNFGLSLPYSAYLHADTTFFAFATWIIYSGHMVIVAADTLINDIYD